MKYNWIEIQKFYDEGHTMAECCRVLGLSMNAFEKAQKRGDFRTRKMTGNELTDCIICGKTFKNEHSLNSHIWKAHTEAGQNHKPATGISNEPWNKGLSKETDSRIKSYSKKISEKLKGRPGRPTSDSTKIKLSKIMKERHKNGTAWNIGQSRWNNEPSWPEKFFIKVIENEFQDKNYLYEEPFYKFSLDFLWQHKKKVIEIDGEQHERCDKQIRRDKEKDRLLVKDGYQILRIRWKDMCNNTKYWIEVARKFIDS